VATADARQQVGHCGVETMTLGVRIPRRWGRELTHPLREVWKQARELTAPRPQIGAKYIGVGHARKLLEGGDERPVRSPDDGVAGAVKNESAIGCRALCELSNESTLPRSGLACEQSDPPTFTPGGPQERFERAELPRAADERKRRRQAERTRKLQRVGRGHSQI